MQKIIKIGPIVSEKNYRTHTRTDTHTDRGQIIDLFLYQKIGQKPKSVVWGVGGHYSAARSTGLDYIQ